MMNRAVIILLVVAALGGGSILFFWQRTPYTPEEQITLAGATKTAILANSPKIEFDRLELDLGETLPVVERKDTFIIRNIGKGVLELKPPHPGCGCTVATLATNALKPGEQVELPFTFSLAGIWSGEFEKNIDIHSNDPTKPTQTLKIKGRIKPFVEIKPSEIKLGNFHFRDATNLNVVVRRLDGLPLNITNVSHSATTTVQMAPVPDSNGTEVRLDINLPATEKPAYLGEGIALFTDDGHMAQPVGVINVNGRRVNDMILSPEQLIWSIPYNTKWDSNAQWLVRTLKLNSLRPDQSFAIVDIKTNLDGLQVSTKPRDNNTEAEIAIRLAKAPPKTTQGSIVITTDHPAVPKIEVPFQIFVPAQ